MRSRFTALFILVALGLSACGGGGGTTPSGPGAPQQPSQPATATSTHTYTLGTAASSYAIPPLAGFSGSVAMPAATVPAGTNLQLTSALTPPAGVPVVPTAVRRPKDAGTLNVYFYTTIQLSATITFQSLPGFSLTLPDTINPAGQQFFYAVSTSTPNSGAVQSFGTQGPATVTGQTVTFAPSNTPLTLLAGTPYIVAFYATSTTATPTPPPSVIVYTGLPGWTVLQPGQSVAIPAVVASPVPYWAHPQTPPFPTVWISDEADGGTANRPPGTYKYFWNFAGNPNGGTLQAIGTLDVYADNCLLAVGLNGTFNTINTVSACENGLEGNFSSPLLVTLSSFLNNSNVLANNVLEFDVYNANYAGATSGGSPTGLAVSPH
jgi:hypothetical protein